MGQGAGLRADARRNREQIIATARRLFAEHGAEVPMDEIARLSGVGVGTLYRRFPDRQALVCAVVADTFQRLATAARAASSEEPDAWHALCRIVRMSVELRLSVRLSGDVPTAGRPTAEDPQVARARHDLLDLLPDLVEQAQRDGDMRADVGPGDVVAVVAMLLRPPPNADDDLAAAITQRCLGLVLDGLRAPGAVDLPGRPLTLSAVSG